MDSVSSVVLDMVMDLVEEDDFVVIPVLLNGSFLKPHISDLQLLFEIDDSEMCEDLITMFVRNVGGMNPVECSYLSSIITEDFYIYLVDGDDEALYEIFTQVSKDVKRIMGGATCSNVVTFDMFTDLPDDKMVVFESFEFTGLYTIKIYYLERLSCI